MHLAPRSDNKAMSYTKLSMYYKKYILLYIKVLGL